MKKSAIIILVLSTFIFVGADKIPKSPTEILADAPASDWVDIDADNIVIGKLADGTEFIYLLAPQFAPKHIENIKKLVRSGWFDKTQIVRVQDNYVVQWGAPENTPLPLDVEKDIPAEYEFALSKHKFKQSPYKDTYAPRVGFIDSWPIGANKTKGWLPHCYSMIGVGRDMAPDVGTGQELYTMIGHSPRHLDRNIALVGRIISGMENLTNRPRGTGEMGFYKEEGEKIPFASFKIAADIEENARPIFQILDTNSKTFDAWIKARANRGAPFFIKPAGAVDICNSMPPVKKVN